MAVLRCPHCGKPNPDFLKVCQYCDGVLPTTLAPEGAGETMRRTSLIIRCPHCGKPNPDFATACQYCDTQLKDEAPAEPAAAKAGAGDEAGEMPDWLRALRDESAAAPAAADVPGPAAAPAAELPDWLKALPAEEAPTTGEPVPDWLKSATGPLPSAAQPAAAEELPDWLKSATGPLPSAAQPAVEAKLPDWLKSATGPLPEEPAIVPGTQDRGEPATTVRAAAEPAAELAAPDSEPDWLAALRAETGMGPGAAPTAAPAAAVAPFSEETLPVEAEPEWLASLRTAGPAEETQAPAAAGLAEGELPNWLAAMRPAEVPRPELEPEVDEYQETVGVLAGMRGVLRAEPSVVLPGKSTARVEALAYSEAQARQAELLAGLLLGDHAPAPAAPRRAAAGALPLERWLVALALLAGVIAAPVLAPNLFPLPASLPAETLSAFQALEAAPAGQPVLTAFDYEPGQAGELGLLADALVGHAVRRGLPLVAVSTSLTGAGAAEAALERLTAQSAYRDGETVLNLGFLPGGPLGIAQWVRQPTNAFRADFRGRDYPGQGLWALPVLSSVQRWEDFGAVIVISASPDDARAWIEQTQGRPGPLVLAVSAGAAPLVRSYLDADRAAAQSAGRPPRLAGLVSGAVGAAQYQVQAGVYPGAAPEAEQVRWGMFGGGLWLVALLLLLGNLLHGLRRAAAGAGRGKV